jgi:hypothetical protein
MRFFIKIGVLIIFILFSSCNESNEVEGEIIEVNQDWALNNWGSSTLIWKYKYEFIVDDKTFADFYTESAKNRKMKKGSKLLIEYSIKNPKENRVKKKTKLIYDYPLKK